MIFFDTTLKLPYYWCILNDGLLSNVYITITLPVALYYNLLGFIKGIKTGGVIASSYGADDVIPWQSTYQKLYKKRNLYFTALNSLMFRIAISF